MKNKPKLKLNKNLLLIKRKDGVGSCFRTVTFVVLVAYAVIMLFMLGWGMLTSLKTADDFEMGNYLGLPDTSNYLEDESLVSNYVRVFKDFKIKVSSHYYVGNTEVNKELEQGFFAMLLNSILYAGIGSIIQAIVPAVVAFMCAKYRFRFSKFLYALTMLVYIIPIVGNYPSMISTLRNLGLFDNFIGYFIMKFSFTGMYFFVYYAFYETMSDAYIEAAEIDGASQLQILVKVVLPLSIKPILTVALIMFVQLWNDYQTPLLYLPTHPTISYGLYAMEHAGSLVASENRINDTPGKMACCMLLALPVLILFIAFGKNLMGNISMGGIKE